MTAVLRHNTTLVGDSDLARREWTAIMGSPGTALDEAGLGLTLNATRHAVIPMLTTSFAWVAVTWTHVRLEAAVALLRRSAFAQEVFLSGSTASAFCDEVSAQVGRVTAPAMGYGSGTFVCLAHSYVVESEAALLPSVPENRVSVVIRALLEPFQTREPTTLSRRLRAAKKTTLSLSHDLHIYKAKFFPRMVRALINIYGRDKTVFDPYCGSGTALLEAALLGQKAAGIDIDPICRMISASKVTPFVQHREETRTALLEFRDAVKRRVQKSRFIFPAELTKKIARRDRIDGTAYLSSIQAEASIIASAVRSTEASGVVGDLIRTLASDAVTKKVRYRFVGVGNGRYTIEIVKQTLLERLNEKIERALQLVDVFSDLEALLHVAFGAVDVQDGDARLETTWPAIPSDAFVATSPPYLPASSGREHYTSARALAFAVLGLEGGEDGYFDTSIVIRPESLKGTAPEANRLMTYLLSDANDDADPQRDAMRFERKAIPTAQYLADIERFGEGLARVTGAGTLALVVADQHTFYSHRRSEIEHVVDCAALYGQILAKAGIRLEEEIELQLLKSSASRAKPRSTDDYHEAVLVCKIASKPAVKPKLPKARTRVKEERVPA